MRSRLLTGCLPFATGLALLAQFAPLTARAQQEESTPVYDFGDAGGVIVYDNGPSQTGQRGGHVTVIQNDQVQEGAGESYWYYGAHPDGQGGWDPTEGAHEHEYPPFDEYLFTQENGYFYFIGDPADFGYPGNDLYNYYGAHPVPIVDGGGYCYYEGYHHHFWPVFGGYFVVNNGWYLYNGPFSPWFWQHRNRYSNYFRGTYPGRRANYGHPPPVHYGHPPAREVVRFAPPVQRMRTPAAPARAGFAYVAPARPVIMRPTMPPQPVHAAPARLAPAPARVAPPARPAAPARPAPSGNGRRR